MKTIHGVYLVGKDGTTYFIPDGALENFTSNILLNGEVAKSNVELDAYEASTPEDSLNAGTAGAQFGSVLGHHKSQGPQSP
jgi:hypothetical protein